MSDVIDTNVVEIRFDNSQFVENVSQTIDSVEALKKSLQFDSSSFDSLNRYASSIDMSNIATNIESLSERFSNFGIIGMTALQRVTNEVMTLGGKLVGLLARPWQQIISGGTKRATNIANAQFQLEGIFGKSELGAAKLAMTMNADAEAIKTITGYTEDMVVAMDAANYAVADTAYGLDSAAKAASVLATSGVDVLNFQEDLKDSSGMLRTEMQVALRSISGVAAMANSSYDEIAHVFERISGNGRIMAIDLQSLSARGLNAAATLRDYLNEIGETSNATEADIREMVSKGKIDFMTFAKAMDSAYGEHAKDANNTFEGAFSNMKFALSKIGADFISPLREKMIPILNDVRMVINSIRKALSFKIKFPWTDEEVSIIELFTRAVTNLTNKAHEFFMMWTGGQTVLEKAMTGFSEVTGSAFSDVKKIFDEVEKGTRSSSGSILELIHMAESSGSSMDEVFKTLAETLNTTEDDIRRMCQNGEISFEEFSNAISATFGNTVWDKRVKQLATVFRNLLSVVYNIASTITSILGPAIEAFMNVFAGKGINGVIGFTNSMADLTSRLRLSVPVQRSLVKIFEMIFRLVKSGLGIVKNLLSVIFRIVMALSPLLEIAINFIGIISDVLSYIVDVVSQSEIFNKAIKATSAALIILGKIIVGTVLAIISSVAPAIRIISNVFYQLNKAIHSVDTKAIGNISTSFKQLFISIGDLNFVKAFNVASTIFAGAVSVFFIGITYLFTHLGEIVKKAVDKIKNVGTDLIDGFTTIGDKIKEVFLSVANFIKSKIGAIGAVLATLESILTFAILYKLLKTGDAIHKVVNAWANRQNAAAFSDVVKGIKQIAIAFAVLAGSAVALSLIPTDKFYKIMGLIAVIAGAIALVVAAFYGLKGFWAWMESKKEKIDPMKQTLQQFFASVSWSINSLAQSASAAMQQIAQGFSRAMKITAVAALIISIAVSLLILAKAVTEWAKIPWSDIGSGLAKMGIMLIILITAVEFLAESITDTKHNLIGAAILMLSFILVLKGFIDVIKKYNELNYGWKEWTKTIIKIGASLLVMAGAVAIIGKNCKTSGFAMMAGAIEMLAFLAVLKFMVDIIDLYSEIDFWTVVGNLIKMAAVLGIFVGALRLMSDTLTNEKSFTAGLRSGVNYRRTGQNFIGLILTLLSIALLLKVVANTAKDVAEGGFWGWLGNIILIFTTLMSVALLVRSLNGSRGNFKALAGIAFILTSISLIFSIMSLLDPFKIMTIAGAVALVLGVLSVVVDRMLKLAERSENKGKTGFGTILAILISLTSVVTILSFLNWQSALAGSIGMSIILASLASAFKIMTGVVVPDTKIAAKMLQVMLAVLGVLAIMSILPVRDVKSLMALTASMAVISVVIGFVAQLLSKANKIDESALMAFAAVGGTIGVMVLMFAGAAAIAAGKESAFAGLTICITALSFVAVALMKLLTLINTNAKVWASFGLFASIMAVITGFAWLISLIAQIGDTSNTVTIMSSLVRTMYGLLPVIAGIQLVISVFALLLQNPMVMLGAAVGLALFAGIMLMIAGFARMITGIAQIGDTNRTVTIMESVAEMMRSLTITLLLVVAVGALGILAIAGLGIIIAAVSSILLLCGIIGGFETIRNAVMTGVALILTVCNAIREVTEIMSNLSLEGIMIFITALDMLSSVNIARLARLGLVGATLLVATTPIMIIGSKKKDIKKGLDISKQMMTDLLDIYAMSKILGDMDADSIIAATKDTLKIADAMIDFSSLYIVSGLAHGLVDSRSRDILKMGAIGMAAIIDTEFRDIMGIHSDSDWGIDMSHWTSSGIGHGMIDPQSVSNLIGGVDGMADIVDTEGTKEFAKAGISNGATYVSTFLDFVSKAGGNTTGVELGLNTLFGSLTDSSKVKKSIKSEFDTYYTAFRTQQIQFDRNAKDYQRNHAGYYSPNLAGPDVNQVKDAMSEFTDYGDLSSFFSSLEDMMSNLTSVNDLMDGIGGLGSSADGASRSVDELTSKIDSLMDKYEDLWDDAKDRANKDLFKGVDKQGDDFLDSIQEIMDKYKNIYHDAVEKTNSEDLFAEVKDEEESFAPETLLNNLEDQVNQVNELNTIISSLGGRIADNGLRAAISSMSVDDLPELRAMYRMDDKQLRSYEQMYQKKVQANQNKIQNELTGSLSQITGHYTNVATYVATDASTNALIHNLQSQIDQLNDYNNTVASLTTRIKDVNLREAIAHMGVESLDELKALNAMTDKQLDEYTAMYNTKISEEARTIKQELSTELSTLLGEPVDISEFYLNYRGAINGVVGDVTEKAGETAGDRIGTGMATGMSGPNVVATATNSGKDLTAATAKGISDEESIVKVTESTTTIVDKIIEILQDPKNDFKESGLKIVDEIIRGLIRGRDSRDFYDTIYSIGDTIKTRLDEKADLFVTCGKMIDMGLARGVKDNAGVVEASVIAVVAKVIRAAKQTAKINSPSRVFMQMGKFMDEGLAIGLRNYSNLASDEAGEMAEGSISAVQDAIQQLSGMLDGSIDINPVITPTLDLSEVNARSAALANMFNGRQIAVQARADDQQAEMITQLGNVLAEQNSEPRSIVFNQTNNSPKALSRTEIYRQTRNGFSQLASAIQ